MMSLEEAEFVTGDDITYWLNNPFVDRDSLAEKVRWWVTVAYDAGRAYERDDNY